MKFLIVGDYMLDIYWSGSIRRLNPEKHAAPLVSIDKKICCPGGAGNVATNIEALGGRAVTIFGAGQCHKNRIVDEDGIICRYDQDENSEPILDLPTVPIARAETLDAIIVSDYGKGSITPKLAEVLRGFKVPTFVDTKSDPSPWTWAKCLFPNGQEYAKHKREYGEAKLVFLKLGGQGGMFLRNGVRSESFKAIPGKVTNPSGAGDTVIASFASAYMCAMKATFGNMASNNVQEAEHGGGRFAMEMASVAVESMFTHAPTIREWENRRPDPGPTMEWIKGAIVRHMYEKEPSEKDLPVTT